MVAFIDLPVGPEAFKDDKYFINRTAFSCTISDDGLTIGKGHSWAMIKSA